MHTLPPIGTPVIDEDGMRGFIYDYGSSTKSADGSIVKWYAYVRYEYDDPGYGLTKCLEGGQISPRKGKDVLCNNWTDEAWILSDAANELKPLNMH